MMLTTVITSQLAVVQFESAEGVGAEKKHVFFWMDRLQLLQSGLPAVNTL